MKITSRDNSLLRRARSVRDGKVDDLIFIEGLRLCEEALRSDLKIEALIYSDQIARKDRAATLIAEIETGADKTAVVSENLLESISYTKTPQGIILLASRPVISQEEFQEKQSSTPLMVILHGINNPVNVGAILRTAEAAGVTGAIVTPNTADPFSPKSLRGAMGSAFRLPVRTGASYADAIVPIGIHSDGWSGGKFERCRGRRDLALRSVHAALSPCLTSPDYKDRQVSARIRMILRSGNPSKLEIVLSFNG